MVKTSSKIIDLSHVFSGELPVYPGDHPPKISWPASIKKDGYNGCNISTGMHIGTHIDAPLHFLKNGKKISQFAPQKFIGKGILIDARKHLRHKWELNVDLIENVKIEKESIVLFLTGFDKNFRQSNYYKSYPAITEALAKKLALLKPSIIGLDTPSPDYPPFKIHKILLSKEVLIVENLTNLKALIRHSDFEISALPIKVEAEASTVRVIARIIK